MSNLTSFLEFAETLDEPFADFEPTDDASLLSEMFGDRADEFQVIGMHGSGSLLAIWNVDGKEPVIWADNGWEASIVAGSVDEFLGLLPYDTGFIYDLAFADLEVSAEEAADQLAAAAQQNPAQPQLLAWLEKTGLTLAAEPASVVSAAKGAFPDVADLIADA